MAQLLGEATGNLGFGLGGGYGLQVHHIADRPSKDLDAYVNSMDVEVFAAAEQALCARLEAAGLSTEVAGRNDWFRAILVTGASPDERVVVDLAYDYRAKPPIVVEGVGPVLDVEDIVTGKVRAFVDRGVERDYSDIASILNIRRWTVHDLYA
ncbi:MAG: nucleotidyl transferase AbiEii/AbiGii toxin family protein, partial [Pseudonocardiaceae bacterium]